MEHLLLLLCLLFLSLQTQARESHFFSKASRPEAYTTPIATEPPATVLPPQSHNGYGLYGGDLRYQSRPTTEYREQSNVDTTIPSRPEYREQSNVNNTIPTEYREQSNVDTTIPSRPTTEYREQSNDDTTVPSTTYSNEFSNQELLPTESYENREPTNANTIPSSTNEFSYETKEPNYSHNKEYGMSDTRFLDNGKYFYDLNAEGKQTKENAEVYRSPDEFGAGGGGNYGNGGYVNGDGRNNMYKNGNYGNGGYVDGDGRNNMYKNENYGNGGYVNGDGRNNMYKNENYGNGGYVDGDGRNNMYKNEMEEYRNNQANFGNQEEYVP